MSRSPARAARAPGRAPMASNSSRAFTGRRVQCWTRREPSEPAGSRSTSRRSMHGESHGRRRSSPDTLRRRDPMRESGCAAHSQCTYRGLRAEHGRRPAVDRADGCTHQLAPEAHEARASPGPRGRARRPATRLGLARGHGVRGRIRGLEGRWPARAKPIRSGGPSASASTGGGRDRRRRGDVRRRPCFRLRRRSAQAGRGSQAAARGRHQHRRRHGHRADLQAAGVGLSPARRDVAPAAGQRIAEQDRHGLQHGWRRWALAQGRRAQEGEEGHLDRAAGCP